MDAASAAPEAPRFPQAQDTIRLADGWYIIERVERACEDLCTTRPRPVEWWEVAAHVGDGVLVQVELEEILDLIPTADYAAPVRGWLA